MAKKRRRTAVLFVHVQGEQSPMDDLLQLAYTIWETDPKAAPGGQLGNLISVPRETAEEGDIRRLITDRVNGRQFHFYQFYWAHLMQGNGVADVWRWLLALLRRPKVEVPETLWRARGILSSVVALMATLAMLLSVLAAARLASPLDSYGAIAANAYALLWGVAGLAVLMLALRRRGAVGSLVSLSASIIVTGALFGAAITTLVAGSDRVLKGFELPSELLVSVTCAIVPIPSRARCETIARPAPAGRPARFRRAGSRPGGTWSRRPIGSSSGAPCSSPRLWPCCGGSPRRF